MENIEQIANLGGTVVTVFVFIWYLVKKDATTNKMFEEFNTTVNNHLSHSTAVIDANNQILQKVAVTMNSLCNAVRKNGKAVK
jgi:hypothetical protein